MKENYTHETFAPGFDPHGNSTKIQREEDLEVAGVNLVGSKTVDAEEAGDETYALPGVVSLPYLAGDYDGIVIMPRPRQLIRSKNHQRQGYSKRKAKRRASWNGLFKARFKERASRLMGWMDSCSELTFDTPIPVNLKSDIHMAQMVGRLRRSELHTELAHPEGKDNGAE